MVIAMSSRKRSLLSRQAVASSSIRRVVAAMAIPISARSPWYCTMSLMAMSRLEWRNVNRAWLFAIEEARINLCARLSCMRLMKRRRRSCGQQRRESSMSNAWSNWSGNVSCTPAAIEKPANEEQLIALLRENDREVRVAGTGHSFVPLCATDGLLLSLENMQGVLATDKQACEATIWAGTPISQIGAPLLDAGLAMQNQGDIDKQALAGAISTGTHVTGLSLGNLSSQVTALRLILATGEVLTCSETIEPEVFKAAQVSLGMLGLISQITLKM